MKRYEVGFTSKGEYVCEEKADGGWMSADEVLPRIRELEAALRDLVDYTDITKHVDADAVTERVKRARVVLGLTVETGVKCQHRFEKFSNGIISCQDCGEPEDPK